MAKFKIGDKVIAKKNAPYGITTNGWKGVVTEVDNRDTNYILVEGKGISVESNRFLVRSEYFDLDASNHKIVISTDGKTTTAKMYDGKTVTKTATAKCSPDDKFDFVTGAKIAFERLTGDSEKSFDWDAFRREKTIVKVTKNNWREFVLEAKKQGLTFCDGAVENPFEMFFDKLMRAIPAASSILEVKPDEIFIMYEGKILKYSHISEGRTVITW